MQFRDLQKQYKKLKTQIDERILSVLDTAHFISGSEVTELEKQLADYVGVKHCISCGNGTDALTLAIRAWGLGEGDAVFVPDFTFFSSGESPATCGCTCIFVDVDEHTYNLDPTRLEEAIRKVQAEGMLRPRAVVAVDLFGQPADYDAIIPICKKHGLLLLEDGAQGFGGDIRGRRVCSYGDISTTSFFPAKPLGCYGDGGAIFTDSDEWAKLIRSLAVHGKAVDDKYDNIRIGTNSRLDTMQAAILLVKLDAFRDYELASVYEVAMLYNQCIQSHGLDLVLPMIKEGYTSSWAQYTVQLPVGCDRDRLQAELMKRDIPTMVYYAKPMHRQGAFAGTRSSMADCPVTERLCQRVLSLPMHPYMTAEDVETVVMALDELLQGGAR